MTRNPEYARALEECAALIRKRANSHEPGYARSTLVFAVDAIRALPVPEPAPDPRDAEIALLKEQLRTARRSAGMAHAVALRRSAP